MITGLVALLVCQLVGELVVRTLDVPVPGPIVGMVLMFLLLQLRDPRAGSGLVQAPETLLRYLQLLYVPAGVGVVGYLSVLGASALPVSVGLVAGWLAALLVTAGAAGLVLRLTGHRKVVR